MCIRGFDQDNAKMMMLKIEIFGKKLSNEYSVSRVCKEFFGQKGQLKREYRTKINISKKYKGAEAFKNMFNSTSHHKIRTSVKISLHLWENRNLD